jgi:hypothetical protein
MGITCGGLFWGSFLILLGVSVILKAFGIDFPVIRILFALFLIAMGVRMLVGWKGGCPFPSGRVDKGTVMFGEATFKPTPGDREHSAVFGKAVVDLTGVAVKDSDVPVEVNAVFGSADVKLDPKIPTRITVSAVFGSAQVPDGGQTAFGSLTWTNKAYQEGKPALQLRANAVFGAVEVRE